MKSKEELILSLQNQLSIVAQPTGVLVYTEFVNPELVNQVKDVVTRLQKTPAITSQTTAQSVNIILADAKRLIKRVEDAGVEMRRPFRDIANEISSNEKNVLASLWNLVETVNKNLTDFQIEEDKKQKAEHERIRKEAAEKIRAEQERIASIKGLMESVQTNVMTGLASSEDIEDLKAKKDKLAKLIFNPEKYLEFIEDIEARRTTWLQLFEDKIVRLHEIKEEMLQEGVDPQQAIDILKQNEELTISQQKNDLDKFAAEAANNIAANTQMSTELRTSVVDGATSIKRQLKYTGLANIEIVPRQYLMVNEAAVKAAIKGGTITIPGLVIEEVISNVSR